MKFIMPENEVKVAIKATNRDLKDRFSVFNMSNNNIKEINDILADGTNTNYYNFINIGKRPYSRTRLFLGFDEALNRIVTVKTPKYRDINENYIVSDYEKEEYINARREMIRVQIDMLNEIQSPLLPEPIDYFEVENNDERMPEHLRSSEPVLVLDYQSGMTLQQYIEKKASEKSSHQQRLKNGEVDEIAQIRYEKVAAVENREKFRIIKDIVVFLKELELKNYAYQGLNTKSILLLRDKTPRFIGLGYLCKTKNGILDENHINYKVCELGYSAPELNNPNIPANQITAKAITCFSLGVLIHQMIAEENTIDAIKNSVVGEYGQLRYPNEYTVKKIRRSPLKGELVHNLICELCQEDASKRLTDYDEILDKIETIIGGKRISSALEEINKKYPKYDAYVSGVQIIPSDTQISHCEEDNHLLEELILGVGFYCNSQSKSLGYINVPGYKCSACGKAYITEKVYLDEIEECLDEIYNQEQIENKYKLKEDEFGSKEPLYINKKNTAQNYLQVSKMTQVDFNISECIYDDEKLELTDVAVAYHLTDDKNKTTIGRVYTKLLVCNPDKCSKVYINNKKLEELKSLLPDSTKFTFDSTHYKEELSVAYKIKRIDNINYCYEDLTKLKSYDVRVAYFEEGSSKAIGYKVTKLKYCPICKQYYITKSEEDKLKDRLPKSSKRLYFKIRNKEKRVNSKIYKIANNLDLCQLDNRNLNKVKAIISLKKENSKKAGYQIVADTYTCKKCGVCYIKNDEIERINKLAPKDFKIYNLYDVKDKINEEKQKATKAKEKQARAKQKEIDRKKTPKTQPKSTKDAKCVAKGENMILCTHDNTKLTREKVRIPCYDKNTNQLLGNMVVENTLYCAKCSRVYLNENELAKVNSKLENAYINMDKPNLSFRNASTLNSALNRMNSFVKKFLK